MNHWLTMVISTTPTICCLFLLRHVLFLIIFSLLSGSSQSPSWRDRSLFWENNDKDKDCTGPRDGTQPINIVKCGDLEDSACNCCQQLFGEDAQGRRLRGEDTQIKVHDPAHSDQSGLESWVCLRCWEAKPPWLSQIFQQPSDVDLMLSGLDHILSRYPHPLRGFDQLPCKDRCSVVQRLFRQNLPHDTDICPSFEKVKLFMTCRAPTCLSCAGSAQPFGMPLLDPLRYRNEEDDTREFKRSRDDDSTRPSTCSTASLTDDGSCTRASKKSRDGDPSMPIVVAKCGDEEDMPCAECGLYFDVDNQGTRLHGNDKGIKVDDPANGEDHGFVHLNCWPAKPSFVADLFEPPHDEGRLLSQLSTRLSASPQSLQGWDDLCCHDRWSLVQRLLSASGVPIWPTVADVHRSMACELDTCSICLNPMWCSYPDCRCPDLQPVGCRFPGCSNTLHHTCQIKYQERNGWENHYCRCPVHHRSASGHSEQRQNAFSVPPVCQFVDNAGPNVDSTNEMSTDEGDEENDCVDNAGPNVDSTDAMSSDESDEESDCVDNAGPNVDSTDAMSTDDSNEETVEVLSRRLFTRAQISSTSGRRRRSSRPRRSAGRRRSAEMSKFLFALFYFCAHISFFTRSSCILHSFFSFCFHVPFFD